MNREGKSAEGWFRVAIVGASSLKGKELAELLPNTNFPAADVKLLDDDESLGQLESVGDEMTFVQPVRQENFENVDFAFFCSREDFTRKYWTMARKSGCVIIDLSYALEDVAGASIRAPWIERELNDSPAPDLEPGPVVVAHPAAVVLALLMLRIRSICDVKTAVATLFEPASEHGRPGLDELHEQTVNLLSFQEMPKKVFDSQVAFNLLARYGDQSHPTLESAERRILSHYRVLVGQRVLVPSMVLLQAPIFHGHAFSLYIEPEQPLALGDFTQSLSGEHVTISRASDDSPSNVSAAGQEEILLSVRPDAQRSNGFWVWAAADNLRLIALCAVDCAQQLATARPRGKLQ